jgi:hypothetical protein
VTDSGDLKYFPASTWDDMVRVFSHIFDARACDMIKWYYLHLQAASEWLKESADSSLSGQGPAGISNISTFSLATNSACRSPKRGSLLPLATLQESSASTESMKELPSQKNVKVKSSVRKTPKFEADSIISKTTAEKDILISAKVMDLKLGVNFNSQKCLIQVSSMDE